MLGFRTDFGGFLNCKAPSIQPLLAPLGISPTAPALGGCRSLLCPQDAIGPWPAPSLSSSLAWLHLVLQASALAVSCPGGLPPPRFDHFPLQTCIKTLCSGMLSFNKTLENKNIWQQYLFVLNRFHTPTILMKYRWWNVTFNGFSRETMAIKSPYFVRSLKTFVSSAAKFCPAVSAEVWGRQGNSPVACGLISYNK